MKKLLLNFCFVQFSLKFLLIEMFNSLNSIAIMKHISIPNERQKKYKKVNQYALLKIIGAGASSKVYVAIDTETKKYYAVKIIRINQSNIPQIRQEIRMMRKIIHPNVIKFKEVLYSSQKSKIYFIIEHSDLGTLSKLIEKGIKLTEVQICSIFKQVVEAIAFIHSKKVAHQDIKPRNILIFSDGKAKISDFGVCHSFQSLDLMFAGTPAYQAPEIFDAFNDLDETENNSIDPIKCDIYSLGVSLYECITYQLPFYGNTLFEIADDMRSHPTIEFSDNITSKISSDLLQIVKAMMEFDPKKRITMEEVIAFFSQFKSPIPLVNENNKDNLIEVEDIPEYNPNAPYKIIHAEVCGTESFDAISASYPTFYKNDDSK